MMTRRIQFLAGMLTVIAGLALVGMGQVNVITFDGLAPTTTRGDLIERGASANVRVALGSSGTVFRSNGTDGVWGQAVLTTDVTGALPIANGGTANITAAAGFDALAPTTTQGDVIFRNSTTNARLGTGTAGQFLRAGGSGANPSWQSDSGAPYVFISGALPLTASGGYSPVGGTPFYMLLNMGVLGGNPTTVSPTVAAYNIAEASAPLTITRLRMTIVTVGTLGSAETGSLAILVNNTTSNAVLTNTLQWNAVQTNYSATGLSIALNTGDFFVPKITPPASWATSPVATFYVVTLYVSPS